MNRAPVWIEPESATFHVELAGSFVPTEHVCIANGRHAPIDDARCRDGKVGFWLTHCGRRCLTSLPIASRH